MAKKSTTPPAKQSLPKPVETNGGASFLKQILLTLAGGLLLLAVFRLPVYSYWLKYQIKGYYKEYKQQKKVKDENARWENRHGYEYIIPQFLKKNLDLKKDVFLVPSTAYLQKNKLGGNWTDDRWMYYMSETNIPKVHLSDSSYMRATHTLLFTQGGANLVRLDNDSIWAKVRKEFGK